MSDKSLLNESQLQSGYKRTVEIESLKIQLKEKENQLNELSNTFSNIVIRTKNVNDLLAKQILEKEVTEGNESYVYLVQAIAMLSGEIELPKTFSFNEN